MRARAAVRGVCESRPGVCGRGRCVDQPGGKHTCVCDQGFQPNSQRTNCHGETDLFRFFDSFLIYSDFLNIV